MLYERPVNNVRFCNRKHCESFFIRKCVFPKINFYDYHSVFETPLMSWKMDITQISCLGGGDGSPVTSAGKIKVAFCSA